MTTATGLTLKQLQRAFGVSAMTLHNWRRGTPTRDVFPMDSDKDGRPVAYKNKVREWAKKNGVGLVMTLDEAAATEGNNRPGPKPKVKVNSDSGHEPRVKVQH